VRVVERQSPWTEFPAAREGGAYYSFATKSHEYGDGPDLSLQGGRFKSGFAGVDCGIVADLGVASLAEVVSGWRAGTMGPVLGLAAEFQFPHSESTEVQRAAQTELRDRAVALQADRPEAILGHGYVVRAIVVGHHDHLVAFEVVARDAYGVIIDWKVLRSWPVVQAR
jgi:hypothetical protein